MSSPLSSTGYNSGLKGSGYKNVVTDNYNPAQRDLFNQLYQGSSKGIGSGLGYLSNLASGDEGQFQKMEAPALRQFAQLRGGIASQFSGIGSGARRSSAFGHSMDEASQSLAESLQSNRMSMQQDAIKQLLGIGESLLGQRTFENNLVPKKQSALMQILASLAGGAGSAGSNLGTLKLAKQWGLGG